MVLYVINTIFIGAILLDLLQVRTLEQRKEIEELMGQVNELEQLRKKQARKIHDLKSTVDSTQHSSQEDKVVADNAVQALSSELRTTKAALMGIQNREKAVCIITYGPQRDKTCLLGFATNKGADHPAHTCRLISTFVIRFLESIIS